MPRAVEDADVLTFLEYLQARLTSLSSGIAHEVVAARARESRFHPIRDYLESHCWDHEPRVGGWLATYLGAEANPYTAKIGRMFLVSMVARVMQPGCKVDHMMILEGPQSIGKSKACAILGGTWFSDSLPDLHNDPVRVSQHLRGKWLIEVGELSATRRADAEAQKAFITRQIEAFTPKYGRGEVREPRQCVFIGTTNPEGANEYLKDQTGGRRFWPVLVTTIDTVGLTRDRDQLFAEAYHMYQAEENWWPTPEFEREHMRPEQEARREADAWGEPIQQWLSRLCASEVTLVEVARGALAMQVERLSRPYQQRIASCLREAGWIARRDTTRRWWEPKSRDNL
jgi:predicted P-loop ATPase